MSVILLFLVVITGCSLLGQAQTRETNMDILRGLASK
jgi:hypothetical protein